MSSRDRLDCEVQDAELIAEIRMTADLIIAASRSTRRLSVTAIDRVLGVVPPADSDTVADPVGQAGGQADAIVTALTSAAGDLRARLFDTRAPYSR